MKKNAFTLIELMMVIAIISVLAAIMLPNVKDVLIKGRNANRMAGLNSLELALEAYRVDTVSYPLAPWAWRGEGNNYGTYLHEGAGGYIPDLTPTYIRRLPTDPSLNKYSPALGTCDGYLYLTNGIDYKLLSHQCPENPGANYGDAKFKYHDPNRTTWAWATYSGGGKWW